MYIVLAIVLRVWMAWRKWEWVHSDGSHCIICAWIYLDFDWFTTCNKTLKKHTHTQHPVKLQVLIFTGYDLYYTAFGSKGVYICGVSKWTLKRLHSINCTVKSLLFIFNEIKQCVIKKFVCTFSHLEIIDDTCKWKRYQVN